MYSLYMITNDIGFYLRLRFRAQYIDIPEGCKKGQIRWTLTKRYLKLSFKVTETKELCFSSRAPSGLEKYTVFEKTEKKLAKIGTPRRGKIYI